MVGIRGESEEKVNERIGEWINFEVQNRLEDRGWEVSGKERER